MWRTVAEPTRTPTTRRSRSRPAVRAGLLGNFVDQFDIFLPIIALAPVAALVLGPESAAAQTGLIFVATLFGRPLGAAIFGSIADRHSRTRTTKIAIAGIAVTTLMIAFIPGHDIGGVWTLWAFVALRFVGGIFLGGEYTAAIPLAMEWTTPRRRGMLSGGIMAMSPLANATIAALTLLLVQTLGVQDYAAWGWRLPFIVGALMALGLLWYYSAHVVDAPASASAPRRAHPVRDILAGPYRRQLWQVFVLMTGLWLFTQMAIPVLTGMLRDAPQVGPPEVAFIMLIATLVSAVSMFTAGVVSQRIGRRRFFVIFGAVALIAAPLAFAWALGSHGAGLITAVTLVQVVTVSAYGPVGAYLAERFTTGVRSSGYGVGYSLSIVVPALYPFWLPGLQAGLGPVLAVCAVLAVASALLVAGAALGPEPARDAPLA
ncbi:MFS transporter [Microbacterium esteraromaticum]|uniref:MFS transporter n=1 Tax=Microbacterium esteraromaticum TaxID=57043 RepID=UPI001CD2E22E|nr:MFS transporter [Microbacterium esteraromaticum]MCA1307359.1 MFS transporter [Microbacterium esteraromaticum]